jgi:hypothetical protein
MKFSWREISAFVSAADAYSAAHPEETKASYALKRIRDQITKHTETFQGIMADIEIDNCEVSPAKIVPTDPPPGIILRDPNGNLMFTRDGWKEKNKQQRNEADKKQFEIVPHFLPDAPQGLTQDQKLALAGFLFAAEAGAAEPTEEPATEEPAAPAPAEPEPAPTPEPEPAPAPETPPETPPV